MEPQLYPTLRPNNTFSARTYTHNPNDKQCTFCKCENILMHDTYINETILKSCYLCHIILNFDKIHIGKAILIHSQVPQKDMNALIHNFFAKNKYIPLPTDIDPHAKLIKFPLYKFAQMHQYIDEYKVFPTQRAHDGMKSQNMFSTNHTPKIIDMWSTIIFEKTPIYSIPQKEIKLLQINKHPTRKINQNKFFTKISQLDQAIIHGSL